MAVTPTDATGASTESNPQAKFDAAVDSSSEMTDEELTNELINQGIMIGGQFIIMPKAQEILNEAMSDDDEE
ncbi:MULTISPECIES: hypothetical protein [unclassified Pseudomonas]|uniref:hypothetical protein n=1 Tax=unclassified Pseudomonas TaxID=196821 RepID=UPI000BC76956|nr:MULTISPECIES: hypothetical protein [unclassified Pseudomonas]PVZ12531.1 hypothetical protein F474_03328 [Pseudomonas sp. URIL14HWK12:I12]PVZ23317.1 hypothetical protein F470_02874 [Pseudomonas sp. URIL14HWK12:I10]PVZ32647.1 hypothetical protein F472_03222 [Pseudomonas sp. URIL14HWK12:I11]SNZ13801.1 hypothetical protein SAMN05660463_02571 [Pseudomonas sp. URIL14HWK12:I9]